MKRWQTSDVPTVKNANNMIEKILKYWEETIGILVITVIIDQIQNCVG